MSNISQIINELDPNLSKEELERLGASLYISQVDTGFLDVLENYARINQLEKILTSMKNTAKDYVLNELENHDNNKFKIGRVSIEKSTSPTLLNYSADPVIKNLEAFIKDRKALVKMANTGATIIDDATGEVIEKVPIKTHGKTIPKITIK